MRHAGVILIFAVGAAAFSPATRIPGQTGGIPTFPLASVAAKDQHDAGTSNEGTASSASTADYNGERSEIEQFVSDMRGLYSDLEHGGGTARREMDAMKFTYVAPATASSGGNIQLNGAWRLQTLTVHDEHTNWPEMHRSIMEERMNSMDQDSSTPPPLLVYLPGLDGFGISATAQFDDLSRSFETWRMSVDKNAHVSFSDLVLSVVRFVKDATSLTGSGKHPRKVVIVGESFGGLLNCAVSMALTKIRSKKMTLNMVLVNPATSFDETQWERFIPILTSLRYLESQEEMMDDGGNFRLNLPQGLPTPYSLVGGVALSATIPDTNQYSRILNFLLQSASNSSNESMLSASSDGFRILAEYLPATTLEHRVLEWLPVGTSVVNNPRRLADLNIPTLIIGGSDDNMLPTKEEADRLARALPDCVKMDISGAGHFVLDTRVNLTEAILDSHIDPFGTQKNYDPVLDWTLPPDNVVKAVIEKRVAPQRERTNPVFFSTDPISGKRRRGLSYVPSNKKPLLFVGNHQLFGQDLGMIISELLEQRGIIARGLAHPIAVDAFTGGDPSFGGGETAVRKQKQRWEFDEDSFVTGGDLFRWFGAVKVSPRNFYRLLQTNQTVLLFPGGVREALHGKGEDYQLFWPEKMDFIRIAAKFNATVVPLSAIGAADSVDIVLDAPELLKLPFGIGANLANFSSSTSSARFDATSEDELFVPPLAVPKAFPARHYFLFGKPYDTSALDPKDQDACRDVYNAIEEEVKEDVNALLEARKDDPYALDGIKRASFRKLSGKEPPTFPLTSLSPSAIWK